MPAIACHRVMHNLFNLSLALIWLPAKKIWDLTVFHFPPLTPIPFLTITTTAAGRCIMCSICCWPRCASLTPCSSSATLPLPPLPLGGWTSSHQVTGRPWSQWRWCFAVLYTSLECGVYVSLASSIFITVSLTFERFQVMFQIFILEISFLV